MKTWPWALLLHTCFVQLTAFIVRPTAAYRALELGVDSAYLGLIAAAFSLIPLFAALVVGRATDAGNDRIVLVVGAVLMVLAGTGLLVGASSLAWLLGWIVLLGLGHLLCVLGEQSRVAGTDARKIDSAFGYYTFAGSLGQAGAPLLLVILGGTGTIPDTTLLFLAALISSGLILLTTFFLASAKNSSSRPKSKVRRPTLRAALNAPVAVRKQLFGAMAVSAMVLAAVELVTVYLPALGVERGISASVIGILLTLRSVAMMMSRLYLGRLVTKFGRPALVVGSTAVAAIALGILIFPVSTWAIGMLLVISGIGLGIGQPVTMAVVSTAAPPGTRGTWLALRLSANSLGHATIPTAVGMVAATAGTAGVFGVTAITLALVSGLSWFGLRRRPTS